MKELLICLGILTFGCIFLLREGLREGKRLSALKKVVEGILQMTKTNDVYSPSPDVLSNLPLDLAKKNITLHVDMKNYMNDEQKQE